MTIKPWDDAWARLGSGRDLHRYADLYNSGIVRNADEYWNLHPFARAHAGRSGSAYVLTMSKSPTATSWGEDTLALHTRESTLSFSAWLKGEAAPTFDRRTKSEQILGSRLEELAHAAVKTENPKSDEVAAARGAALRGILHRAAESLVGMGVLQVAGDLDARNFGNWCWSGLLTAAQIDQRFGAKSEARPERAAYLAEQRDRLELFEAIVASGAVGSWGDAGAKKELELFRQRVAALEDPSAPKRLEDGLADLADGTYRLVARSPGSKQARGFMIDKRGESIAIRTGSANRSWFADRDGAFHADFKNSFDALWTSWGFDVSGRVEARPDGRAGVTASGVDRTYSKGNPMSSDIGFWHTSAAVDQPAGKGDEPVTVKKVVTAAPEVVLPDGQRVKVPSIPVPVSLHDFGDGTRALLIGAAAVPIDVEGRILTEVEIPPGKVRFEGGVFGDGRIKVARTDTSETGYSRRLELEGQLEP